MPRRLDLVENGHRKILTRDQAHALVIFQQVVETEAEFAGALTGLDGGRWRDRGPVEIVGDANGLVGQRRRL